MRLARALSVTVLAMLAACAPTPTPLPVIVEPTAAPTPSDTPAIRIAVDPLYAEYATDHGGFSGDTAITVISDAAFWSGLPDSLNARADAAFALSAEIPDAQPGTEISWAVRINSETVPPDLNAIIRGAFSPVSDHAALRTQVANLGYPDGLMLNAAQAAPATAFIDATLNAINLRIRRIPADYERLNTLLADGQAQIGLIALPTPLLDETDLIVAARIIQYRAAPSIVINFTECGLPIVTWLSQ